ncbi:MAG: class I adenylate cyclase [Deltaproteobacteria bacterium]|jgi:adenylate cyclase class 1
MSKYSSHHKPDPVFVQEKILANRQSFITYNVARLRSLIRLPSSEELELFYSIPLLLHVNSRELPGYVDHPNTPYGIYRFFDSGFWKLAKKRLKIEGKAMPAFILRRSYIRGLYLVGSPGTLDQRDNSELNYWVVIDQGLFSETQQGLFREKLARVKDWAKATFDHNLTFFVLDVEQVRRNDFSGMDEEGGGTLQQDLLKEEFYRTFILIAGQIPYWAVFPSGLNDSEYGHWIETAALLSGHNVVADDYVDLGNLISVKSDACLGGLIWEISKAPDDPVKAFIQASLLAYHHFFQEREGLLCNLIKRRYPEARLDSHLLDPYVLAFRSIVKFYEFIDDEDGLNLIKKCIYLRLTGYPVPSPLDEENPKGQILRHYTKAWSWAGHQIDRLDSYSLWTEDEKLQFEHRITKKLFFLHELVSRSTEKLAPSFVTDPEVVAALRNRRESYFKTEPGKLPYCSASLRAERPPCAFRVAWRQDSDGANRWEVYHRLTRDSENNEVRLFVAPELLRVLGWVILNRLCKHAPDAVVLQDSRRPIPKKRTQSLLEALLGFFSNEARPFLHSTDASPRWWKVFVALDTGLATSSNVLSSVDYLAQNIWGEMFFDSLDLGDIENDLLKCYEIAKRLWHYVQGTVAGESEYRIYEGATIQDGSTSRAIENFIQSFREADRGGLEIRARNRPRGGTEKREQRGPLIDLL